MRVGISELQPTASPGLRFISNAELDARKHATDFQNEPLVLGLSQRLQSQWWAAKYAKENVQKQMLRNLRQRQGVYEPDILANIRSGGGSEIFMMLTNVKCRAAAAWLRDLMLPEKEATFTIKPSPIADLPPELEEKAINHVTQIAMQQFSQMGNIDINSIEDMLSSLKKQLSDKIQDLARESANKMTLKIEDQLLEGGWREAIAEFIDDLVTYQNAFIKGPFPLMKKRMTWGDIGNGYTPKVKREIVQCFRRVSPLDIYPSPAARTIQQGYIFERVSLSITDLNDMIDVPGYDNNAIKAVIEEYGTGGLHEWLSLENERARLENRETEYLQSNETIDALNYWGNVQGALLNEWDPDSKYLGEKLDPHKSYPVEVWKIGRWIIKAKINSHPLGWRPYSMTSYVKVPGSFWGLSIPNLIRDDQDMVNGSARALDNNMGIASGPQVVINDIDRLPAGEEVVSMHPWKIWQFQQDKGIGTSHRPPMEFFQPNPLVEALLTTFEKFSQAADEHAALPSYIYGGTNRQKGAAETASGLSMLMSNANKNMQLIVSHLDLDVTERVIKGLYTHNMLHDKDPSIKGDNVIQARGARSLLAKEQKQLRLNEFMNLTNNDNDMQILGPEGRAFLLREASKEMVDGEIPGLGETVAPQQPDPLEQKRLEVEGQRAQADQAKADKDMAEIKVRNAEIESKEKIAAEETQAKIDINNAKLQADKKIKEMELAASDTERLAQENTDMMQRLDDDAKSEKEATEKKEQQAKEDAVKAQDKANKDHESSQTTSLAKTGQNLTEVTKVMNKILSEQQNQNELTTQFNELETSVVDVSKLIKELQARSEEQGRQLDEAEKVRGKVIAYLGKNGTPKAKELVHTL